MLQKKKKIRSKVRIKKGDNVLVISGSEAGKSGNVTFVDRVKMRVTVEGLNIRKKAVKPTDENNKGGIIEIEGPIHISNIKLQKTES